MVSKLQKNEVMISSEIGKEVIKKELHLIPKLPGVYRMLNDKGDIPVSYTHLRAHET